MPNCDPLAVVANRERRDRRILVLWKADLPLYLPHELLEVLPSSGHGSFIEIEARPKLLRAELSVVLSGRSDRDDGLPVWGWGKRAGIGTVIVIVREIIGERMTLAPAMNETIPLSPDARRFKPRVPWPTCNVAKGAGWKEPQHRKVRITEVDGRNCCSDPVQACGEDWHFTHGNLIQSLPYPSVYRPSMRQPRP